MITIRRAEKSDYLAIARLDRVAWKGYPNSRNIPDGEHLWLHWIDGAIVICALIDDMLTGAGCAFPYTNGIFCVHKIFVDKKHRNMKIGTNLLKSMVNEIDAFKQDAFLTVHPHNEPAIRLYASMGFTEKEFIKGYYRKDEDRFVLTRRYRK